jgi:hypothetical protein
MFMHGFDPIRFYDARHKELLREAQQYRLLHQGFEGTARKYNLLSKTLARLGRYLADWGTSLEQRYGASPSDCEAETVRVY